MELHTRLTVFDRMMEIYDRFTGEFNLACEKYCAHCCTANVTMTTLEGYRIVSNLAEADDANRFFEIQKQAPSDRFVPKVSINRMADICARGEDPPEEQMNSNAGPCPILTKDACPLYGVRPFGCRCMVSAQNCGKTGFADMDPFILTVNDVFLQHIEHIDAKGYTGNFVDVLHFFESAENRQAYIDGRLPMPPAGLVANQPVFVLMIPPEHRERIQPLLKKIRGIQV